MTDNQKFALVIYATVLFIIIAIAWALIRDNIGI